MATETSGPGRRLVVLFLQLALVIIALLVVIFIAYFAGGSLEDFPTEEQTSKVRTLSATLATALAVLGIALWTLLRRLKR